MLRGVFVTDKDDASKQFRIPQDKGDTTWFDPRFS
jgi:hypothetical protein